MLLFVLFCFYDFHSNTDFSYRKKDLATTKKDRVTHCLTICENIVAQSLRYATVNGRARQIKDNQIWSHLMSHLQKPIDAEARSAFFTFRMQIQGRYSR